MTTKIFVIFSYRRVEVLWGQIYEDAIWQAELVRQLHGQLLTLIIDAFPINASSATGFLTSCL